MPVSGRLKGSGPKVCQCERKTLVTLSAGVRVLQCRQPGKGLISATTMIDQMHRAQDVILPLHACYDPAFMLVVCSMHLRPECVFWLSTRHARFGPLCYLMSADQAA